MDIRTAVQEDLPEILSLYRRIVADMKQKGIDIWNEYYPFEYLPEDIEDRRLYLLLAEGRICGAFALTAENDGESAADWTDPAAKAFYLDRLGVDPAFAGRGIGHEALRRAMDLAAKAGAERTGCACLWWTATGLSSSCTKRRAFLRSPACTRRMEETAFCGNTGTKFACCKAELQKLPQIRKRKPFPGLAAFFNPHYNKGEMILPNGRKEEWRMTGAQAVVTSLEKEGVTTVFGYPGAAICPVYDCLAQSPICHILVRQEQNAGHAAAAYGRISGRPGVCITTSGPGALNLLTALATAYMDSVPLVAITGQVSSEQLGRDVFQEADITGAAEPFTKHSFLVKNAADLPRILKEAFYLASTGRQGPVLIDLPVDVQNQQLDFVYPEEVSIRGYNPSTKANPLQLRRVAEAISSARRPVICAGGGVFSSGARAQMQKFAESCRIPVVTTMMGLGLMPSEHPLYLGMLGSFGCSAANYAIRHSDLLILIGARAGDRAMGQPGVLEKRTRIVHIDIDPAEIHKNMEASIPLVADARLALEQLLECCNPADTGMWLAELREKKGAGAPFADRPGFINPHRLVAALSERLDKDSIYVADVGLNQLWSARSAQMREGRFLTSGGMGTMGYALPAAIGARLASDAGQVIAVMGDGGFQMSMQELATLIQHDIPVKLVVLRNDCLGLVRQIQKQEYAGRYEAVDLGGSPDFAALAQVYGIRAMTISDNSEIPEAVQALLAGENSFLLQCLVSPDEPAV